LVSGKRDDGSSCDSGSIVVGASKHSAVSFREAYGKSGCEDDNAVASGMAVKI